MFFSDYTSCIEYFKKENLADGDVAEIRIFKCPLNQSADTVKNYKETILLNHKMEIMEIDVKHEREDDMDLELAFEGMCFAFPTPFKRGDILVCYKVHEKDWCRPFVLYYLTTWDSKEMLSRGYKEHECPGSNGWENFDQSVRGILESGDCTDMNAIGIGIDDQEGNLYGDNTMIIPIDLEYYRKPLEGVERQLQVFSCYEKGMVDSEFLTNCCSAIRLEEHAKDSQRCISFYREELMEQVGMLSPDKKQD